MVVLLVLLVLLPLGLTLLTMVMARFKQTVNFRDLLQQDFAVRGGLAEAAVRLEGGLDLKAGESAPFEMEGLSQNVVAVRVERDRDVILALDGHVLTSLEAARVNVGQVAIDAEGRRIFQYRKVEVYLVEAKVIGRPGLAGVRLRGVLLRKPNGTIAQMGVRLERGFF